MMSYLRPYVLKGPGIESLHALGDGGGQRTEGGRGRVLWAVVSNGFPAARAALGGVHEGVRREDVARALFGRHGGVGTCTYELSLGLPS